MVSLYSPPDQELIKQSYGTLISCRYQGDGSMRIIPIGSILSVVGMIPHPKSSPRAKRNLEGNVYVAEKLGLDMNLLRGTDWNKYDE